MNTENLMEKIIRPIVATRFDKSTDDYVKIIVKAIHDAGYIRLGDVEIDTNEVSKIIQSIRHSHVEGEETSSIVIAHEIAQSKTRILKKKMEK